jgi:hypothetical protein
MKSENVLLAICAPSGTGKTYLMNNLVASNPFAFRILRQVTTRAQRPNEGDTYDFITKEEYDSIERDLVCRVHFNNHFYGTKVPDHLGGKIGVVIASEGGLIDLINASHKYSLLIKVGLDHKNLGYLKMKVNRPDRDIEFLQNELKVLSLCDLVFDVTDNYLTVEELTNCIENYLSINSNVLGVMETLNRIGYKEMF